MQSNDELPRSACCNAAAWIDLTAPTSYECDSCGEECEIVRRDTMGDYWDDYTKYDDTIEDLKATLLNSAKKEIRDRIDRLEKENAELREKQSNLVSLERKATDKLRLAEQAEKSAERKALRLSAIDFLNILQKPAYMIDYHSAERDKCDRCNDDRKFTFTYPSGKLGYEYCDCYYNKYVYTVEPAVGVEARIDFFGGNRRILIWYKPSDYDKSTSVISSNHKIYEGQELSDIHHATGYVFYDESIAQQYATRLNSEQEKK